MKEYDEYKKYLKLNKSECTIKTYIISIDLFFNKYNINSLENLKLLTSSDCLNFQIYLKEKKLKPNSINTHIRSIKVFFNWLVRKKYIDISPFDDTIEYMTDDYKEAAYLEEDEIQKMLSSCEGFYEYNQPIYPKNFTFQDEYIILVLLLELGIRRSELINLKLDSIIGNEKNGYRIIIKGKGKRQRILPIKPDIYNLLLKYVEQRNKKFGNEINFLFVSDYKKQYSGDAINCKIKRVAKRANISESRLKEIHTHTMRHTFFATLKDQNLDLETIQKAMGHSKINITADVYGHIHSSTFDNNILSKKSILGNNNEPN